ncbi:hypothetical protein ASG54_11720 [Aureimonas sp. Leaf460]|nr:hypothetical protein ASG62_14690 [Aureimonas sp. Leaf427]KQT77633.1 hypothetical protein ASG54_11720 [Aureimonas sp. Leaf460]
MMRFDMVILFAAADAIREEKGKSTKTSVLVGVPGVRPQPFDTAGARPQQTRRASRPRTKSFGPRLERSTATSVALSLDLGTRTAGRMTIPNLIML